MSGAPAFRWSADGSIRAPAQVLDP